MKKLFSVISFILLAVMSLSAQSALVGTGGEANGSGGSVSYSVGQIAVQSNSEGSTSISEGVQQPYEIQTTDNTASADGIAPDFKAAMDSYEKFFDEYVIFMKAYKESDDVASMANEYTAMMMQYLETMTALDEIDEDALSDEEALYYAEVMLRINQKLLEVA